MATGQKNISIGTSDNAQDGITLREAFRRIRKNFAEIYGDTDSENLTDTETVTETNFESHIVEKIQDTVGGMVSGNTETNITVTYDDTNGNLDFVVAADITDVNAGSGLTGTNEGGGAATLNVGAGTGITVNADDIQISDNGVDHDQLANRYTTSGSITTYTGAVSVDWSAATNYVMGSSLTGAIEFDFTGFKTGQVLTIHNLTGSQTITLDSDAATSETFNKVGANDYDGSSTNVLIVECIDDDATAVFNYSILTYTSDTTP